MGTGAVSRYKLSRSQKFVMVQNFNCMQMSVSGSNGYYEFVLGAGAKAKTVTSPLIIPSVLVKVFLCFCHVGLEILVQSFLFFCPLAGSVFY